MISVRGHLTSLMRHLRVAGSLREHLTNLIRLNYDPSNLLRRWTSGAGCNEGELRKQSKNEGCKEGELREQSENGGQAQGPTGQARKRLTGRTQGLPGKLKKKPNWLNTKAKWPSSQGNAVKPGSRAGGCCQHALRRATYCLSDGTGNRVHHARSSGEVRSVRLQHYSGERTQRDEFG